MLFTNFKCDINVSRFPCKHKMPLEWAEENKHALGYRHDIIVVAAQAVI